MEKPLVSVIIVGFNARRFLSDCLGSLTKGSYKNIEIVYVDNGSTDGSSAYIQKYYPHIILLRNDKNLGFSPAHEGILKKVKGDAVLLLNTDTILGKNLLEELVKGLYAEKNIGAVQPKILMFAKKQSIDSIGSFLLLNGFLYHVGYEKSGNLAVHNKPTEIFSTKGAIMLIKKEVLDKTSFPPIGNHDTSIFDKDYFTAFEDTDLCHRILLAGYKIFYIPSAEAYHVGGGTTNKMMRSFVVFHSEKNRLATFIKNLSFPYMIKILPRMLVMFQLEFFMYLFIRRNIGAALAIQRAIFWNITHIKETLTKRNYIQTKVRAIKDEEFLPGLIKPVRLDYYYHLVFGLGSYKD